MARDDRLTAGVKLLGLWLLIEGVLGLVMTALTMLTLPNVGLADVIGGGMRAEVVGLLSRIGVGLLLTMRVETVVDLLPRTREAA